VGSSDGGGYTDLLADFDSTTLQDPLDFNFDTGSFAESLTNFQEWVDGADAAGDSSSSSPADLDTVMGNNTPQQESITARAREGLNDDDVCYGMVGSLCCSLCDELIFKMPEISVVQRQPLTATIGSVEAGSNGPKGI
jgi:hypothetical protein